MDLAEVVIVTWREFFGVQAPSLARLDGCRDAAVKVAVRNGHLDVDSLKVEGYLVSVRGDGVLIVAVVRPSDSAALADDNASRAEAKSAAAGEAEGGRVELGDIMNADGSLG
jgi:hypothetical protein